MKKLRDAGAVLLGKTNLLEVGQYPVQLLHQRLEAAVMHYREDILPASVSYVAQKLGSGGRNSAANLCAAGNQHRNG